MKKLITSILPVLFIGLLFTSCKKDNDFAPEEEKTTQHFFQCKIDGQEYKATGINAYAVDFTDDHTVYGLSPNGMTVYIVINKNDGVGTVEMDYDTKAYISIDSNKALTSALDGGSGKVSITEINDQVAIGTFEFEAVNFDDPNEKMLVTEGSFRVPFR